MKDEDRSLFELEMAGVTPLKRHVSRVRPAPPTPTPGQLYRRSQAERHPDDSNFLPSGYIEGVAPEAILSFRRSGVQIGVFRNLEQGRYPIEATLDLHLLTIEEARIQVFEFIHECGTFDVRSALINHGKGIRKPERQAVIKSCVARWLPMFPEVMAFHSAQRFHGGTGAVYVLLKKSEKAKERTREQLGLKSDKPFP